jgi:serine/threonine protein kinase
MAVPHRTAFGSFPDGVTVGDMMASELLGGRYELRGVLGRGGMAEVREGWDTRLSRVVAVKLLYPGFANHPETRERFDAEARSAAGLSNPHIVAVHDTGEHNGTPYIVMERLPGVSLADYIVRGPLPQPLVGSVISDVLAALAAAHDAGVLHRDIKPGNILFTDYGAAKVSDFGIAKTADAAYTMTGHIVGTMAYLSPERLMGNPATPSDDLYALGVVGYEALTGRRPFMQDNLGALTRAILQEAPLPLPMLRHDVDPALCSVIERAMARDPALRFPDARAMRLALSGGVAVTGRPVGFGATVGVGPLVGAAVPVGARPMTKVLDTPPSWTYAHFAQPSWARRNRKLLGVGALVAAFLLAAVMMIFDSPFKSTPTKSVTTSTSVPMPTTTPPTTSVTSLAPVEEEPPRPPPGRFGHPGHGHGRG